MNYQEIKRQIDQAENLLKESNDPLIKELAQDELKELYRQLDELDPLNERAVIMEIRAGTGGDEAELFAQELFRMYQRFCQKQGWSVEVTDSNISPLGGIKSLTAIITGKGAYQKLRFEGGVMRVQRVPKTEKSGRLHTSAASVVILPEAKDTDIQISNNDLRIDVFRASGHGGQSVNTTDSAVRITHLPTGIVVTCQDERSQLKNKEKALSVLRSKLWQIEQEKQNQNQTDLRREMIRSGDRSDKIRTFNYPQNRLTDHRLPKSWHNLETILDGNLEPIIESLQDHWRKEERKHNAP